MDSLRGDVHGSVTRDDVSWKAKHSTWWDRGLR
jgi:hypothetical protein